MWTVIRNFFRRLFGRQVQQPNLSNMRNIIYQATYRLEFPVTVEFTYENARVFTINQLSKLDNYHRGNADDDEDVEDDAPLGYLVVEILTEIKNFESANDAAAHARPKLLVVLSLISLFCDEAFSPYMSAYGSSGLGNELSKRGETRFIVGENQEDWTADFQKMLDTLNGAKEDKKRLIYSLIDRWRKARHMQEESEESMEFDDEVVIAYFHVLELLGTEYYNALKTKIKAEISGYLHHVYSGLMLYEGEYLKSMVNGKTGLTEQLILEGLPIAGKVQFALNELGITGSRLKFLIGNLIKDRNNVAHGRVVYQDKIIFPVPQFFQNPKINEYSLDTLKYLTANAICLFTGNERFKEEWELQDSYLIPTPDEIKGFINTGKYKGLSNDDFANGTTNGINVGAICWYIVDKKVEPQKGLEIFTDYLKNITEEENQITPLVLAAAIMADTAKGDQLQQCENILLIAAKHNWHLLFDMRDVLSFLQYNGHVAKHLEKMIDESKLR
jgi:hypothetical protein